MYGNKDALAAAPGKATSAAAAVEDDDDDGRQELFGAPEVYHSWLAEEKCPETDGHLVDGPLGPLEPARAPLEPVNLRRERHAKFPEVQRRSPAATLTLFLLLTFFAIGSGTNPHDCRRFGHAYLLL